MKKTLIAALLTPVLLSLQGCLAVVGVAGLAGAYYWQQSESAEVAADPPTVAVAAHHVLTGMGLQNIEATATAIDGRLTALTSKEEKVKVVIDALPLGGSKVTVRVGLIDEESARRIVDGIVLELEVIAQEQEKGQDRRNPAKAPDAVEEAPSESSDAADFKE